MRTEVQMARQAALMQRQAAVLRRKLQEADASRKRLVRCLQCDTQHDAGCLQAIGIQRPLNRTSVNSPFTRLVYLSFCLQIGLFFETGR